MRAALFVAAVASVCAASFDLQRAITGVYYSKVSYCPADQIGTWTCGACPKFAAMRNVTAHVDAGHDEQAYVGYNAAANEIVLAFRGTVNLQGWIADGDFFQTAYIPMDGSNCTGCMVHEGLYWAYQRAASVLFPKLQALVNEHPTADIMVTGHSMGAATAGFAFPDVVLSIKGSRGVKRHYNYGSPRLGNPAFVAWLDRVVEPHKEHFRCTNFGDPIVHLAPIFFDELGLGNWLHHTREVFWMNAFGDPSAYRVCNGNSTHEDPTCADSTPPWDMIGFRNHSTYLDIGLGCFLEA